MNVFHNYNYVLQISPRGDKPKKNSKKFKIPILHVYWLILSLESLQRSCIYIYIGLWSIIHIHKHIHRYKHQVCIYLRRSQSIAEKKHFCSYCLATICTFCLLHTWLEAGKLRSQVPPHHSAACFPICRIALYLQCSCAFLQSGCYSSIPGVQIYWLLNWLPVLQNCLTG